MIFGGANENLGGITVKRGPSNQDAYGQYVPKWIIIQGLELRGARKGATFTQQNGQTGTYGFSACLWIQQSEDLIVRNNTMTDCALGIFTMAKDDILAETSVRLTLANNRVYSNGVAGSYSEHGFYVQAVSPVVEGNYMGRLIPTAQGSSYKSRSSGEVFRRNTVDCTAFCMDFVQSEESKNGVAAQADYGTDYVYGNTITSTNAGSIHYGGDNQGEQQRGVAATFVPPVPYRKHLRFWNNTYTVTSSTYRMGLFRLSAKETEADMWGNTFNVNFTGAGLISWLEVAGTLRLGANTLNGHAIADVQVDDSPNAANWSITTGAPIPTDPRLQVLQ